MSRCPASLCSLPVFDPPDPGKERGDPKTFELPMHFNYANIVSFPDHAVTKSDIVRGSCGGSSQLVKHCSATPLCPQTPSSYKGSDDGLFDAVLVGRVAELGALRFLVGDTEPAATNFERYAIAQAAGTVKSGGRGGGGGCGCATEPAHPPNWQSDEYFVEQRVMGVNPCAMRRLTSLGDAQVGGGG